MLEYILLIILIGILLKYLHNFLYSKIQFKHLETTVYSIIFALPFERIPTIELAGVNLKISYLLTLLGVYLIGVLIAKKDKNLLQTKLGWWHSLGLVFLVFSSYSWFSIVAPTRFFATFIATVIVILASILVSLFTVDIFKALKLFSFSMILTYVFGIYQFVGDMVGIPCQLTGLRCNFYTKDVFGIPRVHSTAIEPQHYATFCTWMIFFFGLCLIYKINLLENIVLKNQLKRFQFFKDDFQLTNFLIFLLSGLLLLLTVSKGAIAIFLGIAPLFILGIFRKQDIFKFIFGIWNSTKSWIKNLVRLGFAGFFGTLIVLANIESTPIAKIWRDVIGTFLGDSPTSVERNNFVNQALSVLPDNVLSGIGFGQFGTVASSLPSLIVNNVYLEVWLESGFLAFLVFVVMFFAPLFILGKNLFWQNSGAKQQPLKMGTNKFAQEIIGLTLFFSLFLALIQWTIFSPLYIMPFYIILGLIVSFNNKNIC